MYTLEKWIEVDKERVLYELTRILAKLNVTIGNMKELRAAVDKLAEQ